MVPIKIVSVRDPQFFSEDQTRIRCFVRSNHMKGEFEFIAYKFDCEAHGRDTWERCISGEFGPVKEYDPENGMKPDIPVCEIPPEYQEFSKFINKVNEENAKKSYLSVGILWTSKLDALITELLSVYYDKYPEKKKKSNSLFEKVNRCVELGLLENLMKERFDSLRVVRNKLAHEWDLSINDAELKNALHALYLLDHGQLFEFIEDIDFLLQLIFSGSCAKAAITIKTKIEELRKEL
ncbi:TPA: DUF4145 domain-containing protein [Vibrio parahaemolyticus]|uniref:DUF4145 domain-containing protein n=1 Tax=Vibrio harveyi group TaxID=717610 RepID=UPI0002D27A68|nr:MULTISPECIES: DUF4145 domain-containing protein [Vibrio harveyi group]EGQ7915184.1 DUF4145 domain-containing protein [Vibrio parahaemolyticus]EGR2913449.1 DUF4145 domain-containing protein [Vibrio parahaemolyticus]EGR3154986.1 DUF4145 domain-containing protein [Vibrio parahaemolyticus]EGW0146813.1 DUF4145 domain-containing protein [Vibrio parahaemolyticus]EHB9912153.1 DUF4145 domain-containing protein [Vibrio parahaemolyticus]